MGAADARLEEALARLAEADASRVLVEARTAALDRVRTQLTDQLERELRARCAHLLGGPFDESPSAEVSPWLAAPDQPEPGVPPGRDESPTIQPEAILAESEAAAPPTGLGWWAYCAFAGDEDPLGASVPGVHADHPVVAVHQEGLGVLVSAVSLEEFGPGHLERNLEDIDWLEAVARTHEGVIEQALTATDIVPLRMCTMYEGQREVRAMLARERDRLLDALGRLHGHTEWGVKVYLEEQEALLGYVRAQAEHLQEAEDKLARLPEGGAYLARKQVERLASEEIDGMVSLCAEESHARLSERAADARTNRPQRRELSGQAGEMVLNGAYLVPDDEVDTFHGFIAELSQEWSVLGFRFEATGPWPPYHFVDAVEEHA